KSRKMAQNSCIGNAVKNMYGGMKWSRDQLAYLDKIDSRTVFLSANDRIHNPHGIRQICKSIHYSPECTQTLHTLTMTYHGHHNYLLWDISRSTVHTKV